VADGMHTDGPAVANVAKARCLRNSPGSEQTSGVMDLLSTSIGNFDGS